MTPPNVYFVSQGYKKINFAMEEFKCLQLMAHVYNEIGNEKMASQTSKRCRIIWNDMHSTDDTPNSPYSWEAFHF